MATHTSVLSLENPRDWGAWWAAIYGVTQSRTRLKWHSSSSSSSHFPVGKDCTRFPLNYHIKSWWKLNHLQDFKGLPPSAYLQDCVLLSWHSHNGSGRGSGWGSSTIDSTKRQTNVHVDFGQEETCIPSLSMYLRALEMWKLVECSPSPCA